MILKTSVLIPSYRRPEKLVKCLQSLARQTVLPDEVLVVWQGDDHPTRQAAETMLPALPNRLIILHSQERGVVPAENLALDRASGEIITLIDDDAFAPPNWLERRLKFFDDPKAGAVGGAADNYRPDGSIYPRRSRVPVGKITWYGKVLGNMYDQVAEWQSREAIEVDHLVGYNMSLRRAAFDRFEAQLKPYWQGFETDACLQVKARGFKVLFDFGSVVEHHPTNTAFAGGRDGDLDIKVFNPAYNYSFVLAKHSPWHLRWVRRAFALLVGSTGMPGLLACGAGIRRYGNPKREFAILFRVWREQAAGWRAGSRSKLL